MCTSKHSTLDGLVPNTHPFLLEKQQSCTFLGCRNDAWVLKAINIWISCVVVTLTVTQKKRHRHLCYFKLLSFITVEKTKL